MSSDLLAAAETLTAKGWRLFPVNGKLPLPGTRGFLDATTDIATISGCWSQRPTPTGLAVATGNPLTVLDVDPKNGGDETLVALEKKYGELPNTLRSITPSGGSHYYFLEPQTGVGIRNSQGRVGPGIDIRGVGGYVVVPPSPGYSWDLGGLDDPLQIPAWLASVLTTATNRYVPNSGADATFGAGERNGGLASLAGSLRRRGASRQTILAALLAANATQCVPPLDEREVEQIARSVSRYEPDSPRMGGGDIRRGRVLPHSERQTTKDSRIPERRVDSNSVVSLLRRRHL